MVITRSPFRISFFGGSSDYEDFYSEHGSLLIGTTIDKYSYTSCRFRPPILKKENIVSYSKVQRFKEIDEVENPLIRESIRKFNFSQKLDVHLFADIPSRTGLGGSSSCCCSMLLALSKLKKKKISPKELAKLAIEIERDILKESGGIQDQIWAAYGGFNSIEISKNGDFTVKPMPLSDEFKKELQDSMCLVYADQQRDTEKIAASHANKNKNKILQYAKEAYGLFIKEDINSIALLFRSSWEEKKSFSPLITTPSLNNFERRLLQNGAKGIKLLGSGGCGFFLCISDPITNAKIKHEFKNSIFDFSFEKCGSEEIFLNE